MPRAIVVFLAFKAQGHPGGRVAFQSLSQTKERTAAVSDIRLEAPCS